MEENKLSTISNLFEGKEIRSIWDQTTPNMIQRISRIFERKPLISKEI